MIDFTGVKAITIPEGKVKKITCGSTVLWEAVKRGWNLLERTQYKDNLPEGTYYFNGSTAGAVLPLSEDVYYNGGRNFNNGSFYRLAANHCTLSNITENGFTITSGNVTDLFIAFPYHLNAGETITIKHTQNNGTRIGYYVFNTDGTKRSFTIASVSGSGAKTATFTAPDECWYLWACGVYNANTARTISNITVTIN